MSGARDIGLGLGIALAIATAVSACMSRPASKAPPSAASSVSRRAEETKSRDRPTPGPTGATMGEVSELAASPTPLGAPVSTRVEIVNSGSAPVCGLYVSSVSEGAWGEDRLSEGHTVPPGSTHSLVLPPGDYDVRVTGCTDEVLVERSALSVRGAGVRISVR